MMVNIFEEIHEKKMGVNHKIGLCLKAGVDALDDLSMEIR
jgi:hypothetical protein